ncbi:hypothetical protein MSG28_006611 [Choristoneura fumiferana]|uniref:Uncharacterized protein n=1 Tax=Choristoneura fumiferana TaxID=7141 RepID=A0ACC0JFD5_CHOFU|nr:hypothetical protein MSG28_006611 [Choristoneura fumiferana]
MANWEKYKEKSKLFFDKQQRLPNVQQSYDVFISGVTSSADETIPSTKICQNPTNKFSPKPYWTPEMSRAVAHRRLALKNFRKNPTPDNLRILQLKISQAQNQIRKGRSKGWREFCTSINTETSASEMWRKMRWMKGKKAGSTTADPVKAAQLLQSLTPDTVQEPQPILNNNCNTMLEKPITMSELNNSIKRKDTAPGADDISYSMIYNLSKSGLCIMRAELVAMYKALTYVQEIGKNQVVILSDSKSALQHLARCTSGTRGMPIAYDILKLVYKLRSDGVQLVFQWIPSHVGVGGNEEVDRVAKLAVTDGMCLLDKPYGAELMQLAREKCFAKWQEMFSIVSTTKGIWYGTIESKIFKVPWFDNSSLPRDLLVWAFRVRSGHIPLNSFLNLMRVVQSPLCIGCNKTEDLIHFLLECDQNKDIRDRYLDDMPCPDANVPHGAMLDTGNTRAWEPRSGCWGEGGWPRYSQVWTNQHEEWFEEICDIPEEAIEAIEALEVAQVEAAAAAGAGAGAGAGADAVDCARAHCLLAEPEPELERAADWRGSAASLDKGAMYRSDSLPSVSSGSFARGAALAAHSTQLDLGAGAGRGRAGRGGGRGGAGAGALSAAALASAVAGHAAALRVLLGEARRRRLQVSPPPAELYSFDEYPTRDVGPATCDAPPPPHSLAPSSSSVFTHNPTVVNDVFVAGSYRNRPDLCGQTEKVGRGRGRKIRIVGIEMGRPYRL